MNNLLSSRLFNNTDFYKTFKKDLLHARRRVIIESPFITTMRILSCCQFLLNCAEMAEQSTSQQDQQRLVDIILANVGTVVVFRSGSPADERLVLPLFMPFIQQGEIANLPAYSYYVRISAVYAQEPMSGVTAVVDGTGSKSIAKRVMRSSRELFAKKAEDALIVESYEAPPKKIQANKVPRKNYATKSVGDDLTGAKSVT